jgi:hypothetical protein
MTAEEFESAYAARSGITVDELRALGRVVRRCECEADDCPGWQSMSLERAAEYDRFDEEKVGRRDGDA